jgi:YYY domain-containing protein
LLIVGYLIWLPSSLQWMPNGLPLTYGAICVLALFAALLLWRYQANMRTWLRFKWRLVLLGEIVFAVSFLAFVGIRILNPDLWQPWNGGEKLMDIAYLNSVLRSAYFPPPDPYYAQGYLNYYYYGQFLLSILIRLTGIKPTIGFNLAVPLLFAFTVSTAFSIGYTLAAGRVLPAWRAQNRREAAAEGYPASGDDVTQGVRHGLLAALCVAVLGNLASATQIVESLQRVGKSTFTSRVPGLEPLVRAASGVGQILFHDARFPGFNYWDPSRVVGFTINEFPYWSFLFADLHPHMINIPFTLLVLAVALNWLQRRPLLARDRPDREGVYRRSEAVPRSESALVLSSARFLWRRIDWSLVLQWAFWPLALGALVPINTWDWPAYAGFSGLVVLFVSVRGPARADAALPQARSVLLHRLAAGLLIAVALGGASVLLYAPFMRYYTPIFVGLGWSLGRTSTDFGEFLTVWGFFLFVSISALLVLLVRQRSRWAFMRLLRLTMRYPLRLNRVEEFYALSINREKCPSPLATRRLGVLGGLLLLAVLGWWAWRGYWVLVVMVPLLLLAVVLMLHSKMPVERRYLLGLIFTAFLILVGIEFFYLKDHLDGDQVGWWRMNTLFKFYLQAWVMLGIAAGVTLPGLWRAAERWHKGGRRLWSAALTLLLTAAALYPLLGTPARVADRFPGDRPPIGSLDGMEFMTVGTYTWPDENNPIPLWGDYQAIRWLQDNVRGTPVLAEAPIGYYREFGVRVSSFTGLPTLVGMHESEQRWGWQVGPRSGQARALYNTVNLEETMDLIRELNVEYVYVGPLEKTEFSQADVKFERLSELGHLAPVYRNDLVTIYRVLPK